MTPFNREPDFVNEKGIKWWLDESLTHYATREDRNGIKLKAKVYCVEYPNGYRTRILLDKDGPIHEDQTIEGMGCKIDMLKLMEAKNDQNT